MTERVQVLDHGFISLVESYGSDERIIEAARMSTAKGFLGWGPNDDGPCAVCSGAGTIRMPADAFRPSGGTAPCHACTGTGRALKPGDEKLLRFLWENDHATPFEMAGAIVEVQAPIFVFREWHRHRTQSYNEMSARYVPLPDVNYVPTIERLMMNAGTTNKQAGTVAGSEELSAFAANLFRNRLIASYEAAESLYKAALATGVPKELARVHLPVGRYSRMRAHANLRNWLAFLTLRQAPNAQWEIRQYANALHDLLAQAFPRTLALFDEGRHG